MKFTTSKGLYVFSSFTDKFGEFETISEGIVPSFKVLKKGMTDSEVKKELGATEVTLEDVATFIENPPEGTKDGMWNLFYVGGYVVIVGWSSGSREWSVYAWELDVRRWDAGRRVFSRHWLSEPLESLSTLTLESLAARMKELEEIIKHHCLTK